MKTAFLLAVLLSGAACFAQGIGYGFLEAHYSGMTYSAEKNDARDWNQGYGATLNVGVSKLLSVDLAFDRIYIRETHGKVSTPTGVSDRQEYRGAVTFATPRICIGKTWENASLHGLVGVPMNFPDKHTVTFQYDNQPEKVVSFTRRALWGVDAGIRGTRRIRGNWYAHLTLHAQLLKPYEEQPSHFGTTIYQTVNTRVIVFGNAGVGYCFDVGRNNGQ